MVSAASVKNSLSLAIIFNSSHTILPIDAIEFTYDIYESKDYINVFGEDVIKAIVKNITEGTESHIDKYGTVSSTDKQL